MYIFFENNVIPSDKRAEIEDVLHHIAVGNKHYHWPDRPDEINILRELTGGRGSSQVFEVNVIWRNRKLLKVIKIYHIY